MILQHLIDKMKLFEQIINAADEVKAEQLIAPGLRLSRRPALRPYTAQKDISR